MAALSALCVAAMGGSHPLAKEPGRSYGKPAMLPAGRTTVD
jgi:hypothetical protein